MIKFNRPQSLDGALLINELEAAGVKVAADISGIKAPFIDGAGDMFLDIAAKDESKAASIVAAHEGSPTP
jgi:hypothetical protein